MIFYIAKLCERKISFAGRSMIRNAKISKDLNSDDEDEPYDPNAHMKRRGPKINVKKNRW